MNLNQLVAEFIHCCPVLNPAEESNAKFFGLDQSSICPEADFIVVFPESVEQVQQALRVCHKYSIPVTPRGAGSGLTGGAVPIHGGVVISLEKMNHISMLDKKRQVIVAQSGAITGDIQNLLNQEGYFFPPAPNSQSISSIGGNVSHNASGPRSYKYGATGDFVTGLKVVCMDGKLLTFGNGYSKGFIGYDFGSLMIGSEGTLGIIVEVTLKVMPLPECHMTLIIETSSVAQAAQVSSMIASKRDGLVSAVDLVGGGASDCLREAVSDLQLKKHNPTLVLVELEGNDIQLDKHLAAVKQKLVREKDLIIHQICDSHLQRQVWQVRRDLYIRLKRKYPQMIVEDICVPPDQVEKIVDVISQDGDSKGVNWCAIGNIGEGNLHVGIINTDEIGLTAAKQFLNYILTEACELGGDISFEHGIAAKKKSVFSDAMSGEIIEMHRQLKAIFDPKNLLNPGKIFEA